MLRKYLLYRNAQHEKKVDKLIAKSKKEELPQSENILEAQLSQATKESHEVANIKLNLIVSRAPESDTDLEKLIHNAKENKARHPSGNSRLCHLYMYIGNPSNKLRIIYRGYANMQDYMQGLYSIKENKTKINKLNMSLQNPSSEKKANVSPVCKEKADSTNYRPISIIPILARERIAAAHL